MMNTMSLCVTLDQPPNKVNPLIQWLIRFTGALLLVGCLSIATAQYSSVYAQEAISHTVKAGETLSSIAGRYGVSVSALASYNGIANPNLLRRGQVLRIPTANRAAPASPPARTTPQPQNTPSTPAPAAPQSPTVAPRQSEAPALYPSPTPTRPVTSTRYYTVRTNDTLYGIAARYGVSVNAIKTRNRLSGNTIYVGQLLAIP
jgi:LysM repeat protein